MKTKKPAPTRAFPLACLRRYLAVPAIVVAAAVADSGWSPGRDVAEDPAHPPLVLAKASGKKIVDLQNERSERRSSDWNHPAAAQPEDRR